MGWEGSPRWGARRRGGRVLGWGRETARKTLGFLPARLVRPALHIILPMRGTLASLLGLLVSISLAGCKGGEADSPTDEYGVGLDEEEEDYDEIDQPEVSDDGEVMDEGGGEQEAPVATPEFTEGMSLAEAINAVPAGIERVNIDQEVLARPLQDENLYKPCKLRPQDHFTVKLAVWDGRVVGMDLETKNKKLGECLKQQFLQLRWRDKAKSLNTVEYGF